MRPQIAFMPIEEYQGAKLPYGQVDPQTGQAYFGRGYVQLTHRENYVKATAELELVNGDDLEWHADRALDPQIAADVMFYGMAGRLVQTAQQAVAVFFRSSGRRLRLQGGDQRR